jgi:thymidylate synthase
VFCDVFPEAIALIIERLGNEPIATVGQAHVYANSLDENHRQMAKAWFKQGASSVA